MLAMRRKYKEINNMSKKTFPKFGDFENRCIVGPAELTAEDMMPSVTFHGLSQVMFWPYGTFVDEQGDLYVIVRDVSPGQSGGLMVFSNKNGADNLMAQLAEIAHCHRGLILESVANGQKIWESPRATMRIAFGNQRFEWFEKGILELQGETRGPCCQWYDPTGKTGYLLNMSRCAGTILGKQVEGWCGSDFMFTPPGMHYMTSPMMEKQLLIMWEAFANEYEDGSWEVGTIALGDSKWGFAYIYNDKGEEIVGTRVDADYIEKQPSGWPAKVRFRFQDENTGKEEVWNWTARPRANLVDLCRLHPLFHHYRGAEAICTREGETRKITYNFGWPDFYSDNRDERWLEKKALRSQSPQ